MKWRLMIGGLAVVLLLNACGTLRYYTQAIGGQLDIVNRAEPIETLLHDPQTPAALRGRLHRVLEMRTFASTALYLPDNDSYRRYAALDRPHAVWNVFAAPALSMTPEQWCFLIVGCVAYRGYFAQEEAERFAAMLASDGLDVYVAGVPAFSTLGWFDDPVLSTFIHKDAMALAGVIFHELAHQVVYVKGDSGFSESFATVVELEGVRRWAHAQGEAAAFDRYLNMRQRREQFAALVLQYRERLAALYASAETDATKRQRKTELLAALGADYQEMRASWGGWNGYDFWFAKPINNAQILSVGLYHQHVAALQLLLADHNGELAAFYRAVEQLGKLPPAERNQQLAALKARAAAR